MNTYVKPLTPQDLPTIERWIGGWAKKLGVTGPDFDPSMYPLTGYIIPGVAASFLYTTDSNMAYIDNSISNPEHTTTEERIQAFKLLAHLLIQKAKERGIKYVFTMTKFPSLRQVCEQYGVSVGMQEVFFTRLKEEN